MSKKTTPTKSASPAKRRRAAPAKPRQAVVVLGMHRSGTSALAGVLARLGCDLPTAIMPANESNPKGFYESLRAYEMNDAILTSGGSSWDDWQPFNPSWFASARMDEFLERGAGVLEDEYGDSRLFVLKDPRICRLMPFWSALFAAQKITPVYVLAHRNPIEVARSLETREGWPRAAGLLLWLRHVLEAEAGSRGATRCFTSYDRLLAGWAGVVEDIHARTGLNFPRFSDSVGVEIDEFLTSGLRNSVEKVEAVAENPMVSAWVRASFEIMERWAEAGEDEADQVRLDEIRAEFDMASPMFGPMFHAMRAQSAQAAATLEASHRDRAAEIAYASKKYDELLAETEQRLQEQKSESDQELQQLEEQLKALEEDRWQIKSALEQRSQEAEDVGRQNAEHTARIVALEAELEATRDEKIALIQERDQDLAALGHERDQLRKSARMMRLKLQEEFESQLKDVLTAHRKHADAYSAGLEDEIRSLTTALEMARQDAEHQAGGLQRVTEDRDRSIMEREALAETRQQQQQQIAELEHRVAAYANSTSWKLTGPLRRIVRLLRR